MSYILYLLFLLLGLAIAYILLNRSKAQEQRHLYECERELELVKRALDNSAGELKKQREELIYWRETSAMQKRELTLQQEQLSEKQREREELQKRLTSEFENIANRVLKERSAELTQRSNESLSALINPLGERIEDFKKQVNEAFGMEMRDKISLKEEVRKLTELNSRVSQEANNLTKALKGDVKQQGNWGEVILERVLECSGLTLGREYEREEVIDGVDGNKLRPDVIIHLPDSKHIIVDSKVSLVAYERMVAATDELSYGKALKEHIYSIKNHIKGLSDKNYTHAFNINSPDFVLMFMPIESSFATAIQSDQELYRYAWDKKIIIVSPTTLLATLRTVSSIWRQENQTRNAMEIARLSGAMYDKLVLYVQDMKRVKESIERAGKGVDEAMKKMSEGQGNVLRSAEKIKTLGAKTGKSLPQELVE